LLAVYIALEDFGVYRLDEGQSNPVCWILTFATCLARGWRYRYYILLCAILKLQVAGCIEVLFSIIHSRL